MSTETFHLAVHGPGGRRSTVKREDKESNASLHRRATAALSRWQAAEPDTAFDLHRHEASDTWHEPAP